MYARMDGGVLSLVVKTGVKEERQRKEKEETEFLGWGRMRR